MTDPFSTRDLAAVSTRVRWTANSRYLSPSDIEDIAAEMLLAATRTAPMSGVSIAAAAIGNTKRMRYVTRKVKDAKPYARSFRFGLECRVEDLDAEDYDNYVLYRSGHFGGDSMGELEIRDLIRRLPGGQSEAFTLCGEYGYTLEQAAEMLGVSVSTVHRNLGRARQSLQQSLLNP